jgi:hypothetical protein
VVRGLSRRLLGVSVPYIDAAAKLTPAHRRAIANGNCSLSDPFFSFENDLPHIAIA